MDTKDTRWACQVETLKDGLCLPWRKGIRRQKRAPKTKSRSSAPTNVKGFVKKNTFLFKHDERVNKNWNWSTTLTMQKTPRRRSEMAKLSRKRLVTVLNREFWRIVRITRPFPVIPSKNITLRNKNKDIYGEHEWHSSLCTAQIKIINNTVDGLLMMQITPKPSAYLDRCAADPLVSPAERLNKRKSPSAPGIFAAINLVSQKDNSIHNNTASGTLSSGLNWDTDINNNNAIVAYF